MYPHTTPVRVSFAGRIRQGAQPPTAQVVRASLSSRPDHARRPARPRPVGKNARAYASDISSAVTVSLGIEDHGELPRSPIPRRRGRRAGAEEAGEAFRIRAEPEQRDGKAHHHPERRDLAASPTLMKSVKAISRPARRRAMCSSGKPNGCGETGRGLRSSTATTRGRGSTPVAPASAMAMGAMITAMALFETNSVSVVVRK